MNVLIFSTGWMGGFGVINALIRPHDHIVMDYVSHNCLQEGAISATKNIKRFAHLDQEEMTQMLKETREKDPHNAILVITEGLFSMDADSPDLIYYQKITKQYNAFLLIDCAHDFGHLGEKGKGINEIMQALGRCRD
jgi:glycine C-acetyltransferase